MSWKIIAAALGFVLASFAVVAVLAGPDEPSTDPTPEPTTVATEEPTAEEPTALPTEDDEQEPTETVPTPDGESPEDDGVEGDNGQREIVGIPDENPNFVPNDDEECEKGETDTKTTPGGAEVNVPCQAEQHGQSEHAQEGHPVHDHGPNHNSGE